MIKSDFLIIGSGIAGLSYALKVAESFPKANISIVTKSYKDESNTKYAQGGIAVVMDKIADSFEQHVQDTLLAGDGLCDSDVVEFVVREGPQRFNELVKWGVHFDKNCSGRYDLGLEGGHSINRILHHQDITGFEIEEALLERVAELSNITLYQNHFTVDLITKEKTGEIALEYNGDNTCYGAEVIDLDSNELQTFLAKITLMATGGCGQIYQNTTNPTVATGDGIAMALRAQAKIADMEFIQFHPTALYEEGLSPSFLISEAVRGAGAVLRNLAGEAFMRNYHSKKDLASRDIVSRAIDSEMKRHGDNCVYLDCRKIDKLTFTRHFPNIFQKVIELGINPFEEMIPVVPAAHYLCGGIVVDEHGQTSVTNLFAVGECSRTGLHGANRLASNSLLEALVFGHRAFLKSVEILKTIEVSTVESKIKKLDTSGPEVLHRIYVLKQALRALMTQYAGLIRTNDQLCLAHNRLKFMQEEVDEMAEIGFSAEVVLLRNMIAVSVLVVKQSMARKENRGVCFKEELVFVN